MKKHTLAITVENKPGVLTRVATMFRRRGYNIESLAVGETENPSVSRMTVVVSGDDKIIEQVSKQPSGWFVPLPFPLPHRNRDREHIRQNTWLCQPPTAAQFP
jgi:acetolactate synthase regulatory subunit